VAVPTSTNPLAPDTVGERVAMWLAIALLAAQLGGTVIGAVRIWWPR
jgi:hypothetical protein